jgi:hypothetical protein
MKKDDYNTQMPDYIPAGKEYLYPASGGVFCDFVPEGMTALEVRPDEDAPAVSTEPVPDYAAEGQTLPVTDEQIEAFSEALLDTFVPARTRGKKNA